MIVWDEKKNIKLKLERNISFETVSDIILNKQYLDILDNPSRADQNLFVIEVNKYIYAVPFIIDKESNIVLKTIFPSRKLNKKYGGNND
ncbi:MAG: toxin [Candidatus Scalindua sp. AMX11]|nr:MAG: toxin [Candidatus Scalindua sp.]NOG82801.1 toxin [Planctomycetota bacterium]RZV69029.1 MAG: toxin [Candidatus Scalindua sp. SCAELEC01]TDE63860.1 MAG: toxin [Candidatus Scalindua sp. AMX11]GJQ60426.1 MAG: hypothetical protein SCALA701_32270 [Candidatus Scalindua sp.]